MRLKRIPMRVATLAICILMTTTNAAADAPQDTLGAAVKSTAGARTARVSIVQRNSTAGRVNEMTASGVLVGADHDLVVSSETGPVHRVSVGPRVKERRPDSPGQPWREKGRPAPSQATALGALTLPDGTSLGDSRLYATITDRGSEALPGGNARKIVGE